MPGFDNFLQRIKKDCIFYKKNAGEQDNKLRCRGKKDEKREGKRKKLALKRASIQQLKKERRQICIISCHLYPKLFRRRVLPTPPRANIKKISCSHNFNFNRNNLFR